MDRWKAEVGRIREEKRREERRAEERRNRRRKIFLAPLCFRCFINQEKLVFFDSEEVGAR